MALNLADLGSLLTVLVGVVCGPAAAHIKGAGWYSPLFAVPGFAIAWIVGSACHWLAYAALNGSGRDPRYSTKAFVCGCLYMMMPLISKVTAGGAVVLATEGILALFS